MLITIISVLLIIAVIVVAIVVYDTTRFVVTEYQIKSDKLEKDHTFLFVSDLHSRSYGNNNKRLFDVIDKIDAEAALVAGDIITARAKADNTNAVYFINNLAKRMPIFYGIGNHELRAVKKEYYGNLLEDYLADIKEANAPFIDNQTLSFEEINIIGLSIDEPYYNKLKKMTMPDDYVANKAGKIDESKFNILLAHNPEYMTSYAKYKADLILSGHFHGGIARIPFIGGVISPRLKLFPKYSGGLYKVLDSTAIVSRGLGVHSIPVRFLNPAELIVIRLKKD